MSKKSSSLRFLEAMSSRTQINFKSTVQKYEQFHGLPIDSLVLEALDEQDERVPEHRLKIIERIESFQDYLISEDYVFGTISVIISRIKTLYRKNRVRIPYITPLNPKQVRRRDYITYQDILTKDELRCVLQYMRLPAKARLYTMIQGGLSSAECEKLTTRAFIDETRDYHHCGDDVDALKWLAKKENPIIWVTMLVREKTKKPYYALIGAEAVNMIAKTKLYEMQLPKNGGQIPPKLLNMNPNSFANLCRQINKQCNLGEVAEESKLRQHNLRRFHATHIRGSALNYEEVSLTNWEIDEMQGRGKTNTQDTYIKSNPLEQKLLYAKVINNVSLYNEYDYQIVDGDVVLTLRNQLEENKKLKNQVDNLEKKLENRRVASANLQKIRDELGDDGLRELIGEILNVS